MEAQLPVESESETSNQSDDQIEAPVDKKHWKRHISRRNGLIAAAVVLVLVAAGLLVWRSRRMGYTKQYTIESWHAVAVQSDAIAGITKGDPSLEKTSTLATSLRKLDGTIKDQKISLSLIPMLLNDRRALESYSAFVTKMVAYSSQIAGMSDDVTAITEEDVTSAQSLSVAAMQQTAKSKEQLNFLSEDINSSLFKAGEYLASLKKASDDAKAKVAADIKSKKQLTEQDALDKQLVELSITGFIDGYISGDATKMKRYMTPAFNAEYNFTQLSAESRKYTYPASYRVVSNAKSGDAGYSVQVNVLYKYKNTDTNTTDQYTNSFIYTVIYVPSSGRWLINNEKAN